jgi:hypothetical protein
MNQFSFLLHKVIENYEIDGFPSVVGTDVFIQKIKNILNMRLKSLCIPIIVTFIRIRCLLGECHTYH